MCGWVRDTCGACWTSTGQVGSGAGGLQRGEGAVSKYDGVPPYAETQQYVRAVTALYQRYKAP